MSDNDNRLTEILTAECERHNIMLGNDRLFAYLHAFPADTGQISLFDR
jgi:hypothetical protein